MFGALLKKNVVNIVCAPFAAFRNIIATNLAYFLPETIAKFKYLSLSIIQNRQTFVFLADPTTAVLTLTIWGAAVAQR
jgi:hypothetical protein